MAKTIDTETDDSRANRRSLLACTAALVVLCACGGGDPEAVPADSAREQVQGRTVSRTVTQDKFGYASYYEESAGGCRTLFVEVFAFDSYIRSDGTPSAQFLVNAQLVAVDFCNGTQNFLSGQATPESLHFRNDLEQASVNATIVLDDLMGTTKALDIDLAWDGGELTEMKDKHVFVTPISRTVIKASSRLRRSETLSGALVLDGADLLAAGRPVQSRFTTQYVASGKGSTIDITRTP